MKRTLRQRLRSWRWKTARGLRMPYCKHDWEYFDGGNKDYSSGVAIYVCRKCSYGWWVT